MKAETPVFVIIYSDLDNIEADRVFTNYDAAVEYLDEIEKKQDMKYNRISEDTIYMPTIDAYYFISSTMLEEDR